LENVWSSASDEEEREKVTGVAQTSAMALEDVWELGSQQDDGREEDISHPAGTAPEELEDVWSSASDEEEGEKETRVADTPAMALEEDIESGSGQDEGRGEDIESVWSSEKNGDEAEDEDDISSSQPSANSQFEASQSRITLRASLPAFLFSENWPDLANLEERPPTSSTSGPRPFRVFGPEDFPNLRDDMFEDRSSDSDSEECYIEGV
jgi:hypothetical protein